MVFWLAYTTACLFYYLVKIRERYVSEVLAGMRELTGFGLVCVEVEGISGSDFVEIYQLADIWAKLAGL